MRITLSALKICSGALALWWATTGFAALPGTASSAPPSTLPGVTTTNASSIAMARQQTGLAGTCGGATFNVNTLINVGTQASADVRLSAPGVGVIEEFVDETGKNIGPYAAQYPTFQILPFGGGLAPNTPITLTITTYSGPNLTGKVTYTSTVVFNCTTGAILHAPAAGSAESIPALSPAVLAALIALLALLGVTARR